MHHLGWFSQELDDEHFNNIKGIYIIWYSLPSPVTIYVGQGQIKNRIKAHRADPDIQKYAANHNLFISWAEVTCKDLRNEIEGFLAGFLKPLVGYRHPNGYLQAVNLPENFPDPSNSPWYQFSRG